MRSRVCVTVSDRPDQTKVEFMKVLTTIDISLRQPGPSGGGVPPKSIRPFWEDFANEQRQIFRRTQGSKLRHAVPVKQTRGNDHSKGELVMKLCSHL